MRLIPQVWLFASLKEVLSTSTLQFDFVLAKFTALKILSHSALGWGREMTSNANWKRFRNKLIPSYLCTNNLCQNTIILVFWHKSISSSNLIWSVNSNWGKFLHLPSIAWYWSLLTILGKSCINLSKDGVVSRVFSRTDTDGWSRAICCRTWQPKSNRDRSCPLSNKPLKVSISRAVFEISIYLVFHYSAW